ncbi:MAG: M56 family metallopeptidase, partial [Pirellula sp.]
PWAEKANWISENALSSRPDPKIGLAGPNRVRQENWTWKSNNQELDSETTIALNTVEAQPTIHRSDRSTEFSVLFWAWVGSIALVATGFLVRYSIFRLWLHRATSQTLAHVDRIASDLSVQLGLRRAVRVRVLDEPLGPAVFGVRHPTILLPRLLVDEMESAELRVLIAHEMIHVRRGDLYWALLQSVVRSLWWFHPMVWVACLRLSQESERSCDEETISSLKCDVGTYARCLVKVLEHKHRLYVAPALPGVRPVQITVNRLERIMKLKHGGYQRNPRWMLGATIVFGLLLAPGARLTVGQQAASKPEAISDAKPSIDSTSSISATEAKRDEPQGTWTALYPIDKTIHNIVRDGFAPPDEAENTLLSMLAASQVQPATRATKTNSKDSLLQGQDNVKLQPVAALPVPVQREKGLTDSTKAAQVIKVGDILGVCIDGVLPWTPLDKDTQRALGFPIVVQHDGNISLPSVNPFRVAGKTVEEAIQITRQQYLDAKIFSKPSEIRVAVTIMKRNSDANAQGKNTSGESPTVRSDLTSRKPIIGTYADSTGAGGLSQDFALAGHVLKTSSKQLDFTSTKLTMGSFSDSKGTTKCVIVTGHNDVHRSVRTELERAEKFGFKRIVLSLKLFSGFQELNVSGVEWTGKETQFAFLESKQMDALVNSAKDSMTLLSAPSLCVLNGIQGICKTGSVAPIANDHGVALASGEFVEVGIEFEATPTLKPDKSIQLNIKMTQTELWQPPTTNNLPQSLSKAEMAFTPNIPIGKTFVMRTSVSNPKNPKQGKCLMALVQCAEIDTLESHASPAAYSVKSQQVPALDSEDKPVVTEVNVFEPPESKQYPDVIQEKDQDIPFIRGGVDDRDWVPRALQRRNPGKPFSITQPLSKIHDDRLETFLSELAVVPSEIKSDGRQIFFFQVGLAR